MPTMSNLMITIKKHETLTAKYMSIAVFRSDYVTACAASTSLRFDSEVARNRQLHIFVKRYQQLEIHEYTPDNRKK